MDDEQGLYLSTGRGFHAAGVSEAGRDAFRASG